MSHPESEHPSPESHAESHTTPAASEHPSAEGHAESHAPPPAAELFTPAELAALHADDRATGRHIVSLMIGIFLTGIVIYSIVDYVVGQG